MVAGAAPGEVVLADVPAYKWRDGCAPTAVGMVIGYWDAHGYPDLASGEVTVENVASQQMIASHGTAEAPRPLRGLRAAKGSKPARRAS